MKKMKLFPKTFLYVFSLMAAIALISHALFFFLMPVVYTSQKEDTFQNIETQLITELQTISEPEQKTKEDTIEKIVRKYAQQNQMGIFVYYAGYTYHFMSGTNSSDTPDSIDIQEEFDTNWRIQVGEETGLDDLWQDSYRKEKYHLFTD